MKILYSAYACDPYKGSEAGNGWNWAYKNSLLGHQVWCLTTIKSQEAINKKLSEINNKNIHIEIVKIPKWVDYIYQFGPGLYFSYLFWQHKAYRKAKKLNARIGFDIVHHTTWGSLQLGTSLWKLEIPLIFGPCGGGQFPSKKYKKFFYKYWRTEKTRKFVSQLLLSFNPYVKNTLKKAELILATNQETYDMARDNGAKNVKLFLDTSLPEDFYPKKIPSRALTDKLKILWVGRLFARKGLPLVLEALSLVNPDVIFELTILGDGPMGKYIHGWLEQYNLHDKVNWPGSVSWEDVQIAYREHDLFMFCSLRDSSAAQFLEAMAYGLPILTVNIHGARNLVPNNAGIKVELEDPENTVAELSRAVEYFSRNPNKRKAMGENGYEFAKSQTWKIKTGIVNGHYQEIIDRNS